MSTTCIVPCKDHLIGPFSCHLTDESKRRKHSCFIQANNNVSSISDLTLLGRVQSRIDCEFDGQIFDIDRFKGTCGVFHKMDGSSQLHPNNFNIP